MFSDLKLLCGPGRVELPCHLNILVARSPVFRAMFQHDTAEAQKKEIEMTDVEPEVAERMLTYIYTGSLGPDMGGREADLLATADKYSLLELKEYCEEVRDKPGRPLEREPVPDPAVKDICQACGGERKRGVAHVCNVTSLENNTMRIVEGMSGLSQQRMAARILDNIREDQAGVNIFPIK